MKNIKYDASYVKALCVMVARGDILDIEKLKGYLEYIDLDMDVSVSHTELNMLMGTNIDDINPKYYLTQDGFEYKYKPIDLILYSCMCNRYYYNYKLELLKEILKLDGIDFSHIGKSMEHVVSNGCLELFKLLNTVNINYNSTHNKLKNSQPYSILDNCLSLVIARLTINGKDIADNYPKEILEYFLSMDDNIIDFNKLKCSLIMLDCMNEDSSISDKVVDTRTLFAQIRAVIDNYEFKY